MAQADSPDTAELAAEDEPLTADSRMEDPLPDTPLYQRIRWKMAITAGVMAVFIGGLAAWATLNLGIASIAFVVGAAGSGYYLYQKRLPSEAIGSGLWISALLMLILPIAFYLPVILDTDGAAGAEAAGTFIGSIAGLLIWGFVFFVLAIVVAAIGYFFKQRANKKLEAL